MPTAATSFVSILRELRDWVLYREERRVRKSDAYIQALENVQRAANETLAYLHATGKLKRGRKPERERELSERWLAVQSSLLRLRDPKVKALARRARDKARYWACVDRWSDQDLAEHDVSLVPLLADIELFIDERL